MRDELDLFAGDGGLVFGEDLKTVGPHGGGKGGVLVRFGRVRISRAMRMSVAVRMSMLLAGRRLATDDEQRQNESKLFELHDSRRE